MHRVHEKKKLIILKPFIEGKLRGRSQ